MNRLSKHRKPRRRCLRIGEKQGFGGEKQGFGGEKQGFGGQKGLEDPSAGEKPGTD